jgi:uncharacterized coiled-coil protein SlyX
MVETNQQVDLTSDIFKINNGRVEGIDVANMAAQVFGHGNKRTAYQAPETPMDTSMLQGEPINEREQVIDVANAVIRKWIERGRDCARSRIDRKEGNGMVAHKDGTVTFPEKFRRRDTSVMNTPLQHILNAQTEAIWAFSASKTIEGMLEDHLKQSQPDGDWQVIAGAVSVVPSAHIGVKCVRFDISWVDIAGRDDIIYENGRPVSAALRRAINANGQPQQISVEIPGLSEAIAAKDVTIAQQAKLLAEQNAAMAALQKQFQALQSQVGELLKPTKK